MTFPRFLAIILLTSLGLMISCEGGPALPDESASRQPDSGSSSVRMYLPQFRGRLDGELELTRLVSAAATIPSGVDPLVWSELTTELSAQVADSSDIRSASVRPTGQDNFIEISVEPDGEGGTKLAWDYVNVGDYDLNGEVNISDLVPIGIHFGKKETSPDWEKAIIADGDGNGEVNVSDVTPIGRHFRTSCSGYNIYARNSGATSYVLLGSLDRAAGTGSPPRYSWPLAILYDEYVVAACDFEGDDRPVAPIVRPGTTLLEDGGIGISNLTGDSLTLSGDTSAISPGQLLVSGEGEGFLGIVDSISPSGSAATVQYTQGNLEDLFDFAEIDYHQAFGFEDIDRVETFIDGVELTSLAGTPATSTTDRSASDFGDLVFKFKEHEFGAKENDTFYGLTLQGEVHFKLDITTEIDIGTDWEDLGELYSFNFGMTGQTTGQVTAKVVVKKKWTGEAKKIMSIYGAPIPLLIAPVPVVFTPQLDVYMGLLGEAELAATFSPSVTMVASAGLKYTKSGGWDPYFEHSVNGAFGWEKTNVYGKLQLDLNLLSPQPTLKIYGVAGPYAKFHAPFFRVAAQLQANPPEFSVTGSIGARAYVGAEVNILGYSLAKYELEGEPLFNVLFQLYQAKWPLFESELQFSIEWEAESQADLDTVDIPWTPDRSKVRRPYVVWLPLAGGFPADSVRGGDPSLTGSLDEEPYALWTESVVNDAHGNPQSGTVTVYIGRMHIPAQYAVYQYNNWVWPVRITRITVSGVYSGSFSFPQDVTLYKNNWNPVELDTGTGEFVQNNPADEPGYFPLL